jgi:putative membrane protein
LFGGSLSKAGRSKAKDTRMASQPDARPGSGGHSGANDGEDPRIRFAAERTLLAWLRTGLALMGFGFVVARFGLFLRELAAVHESSRSSHGWSLWIGTALVVAGVGITILAAVEHKRLLERLNRRESYIPPRWSLGLAVSLLFILIGLGMAAYLVLALQ